MKTTIIIIKVLLAIFVITATIFGDFFGLLLGIFVGMIFLSCISVVSDRDRSGGFILAVIFLFCSIFFYLRIEGVQAVHHKDSKTVEIVTPFYTLGLGQVLGTGIRLDTLRLAECLDETYFGKYRIKSTDMYLLTAKDSSQTLFSNSGAVLSGKNLQFMSHETPWGKIDVCKFIDKEGIQQVYDLWGHDIHSTDYTLPILEYRAEIYYTY